MSMGHDRSDTGRGKSSKKSLSQCHLSTTNPTCSGKRSNPSFRGEKLLVK